MSRSYQRPENALKRASEFIDVGKPNRALEVLYEVIKRGKMRSSYSEKLLEPIMFKYLELCVDLKKSHLAKEGLYQYRNIFQSVNVSSLETVVRRYLSLAEERTDFARRESHQAVVDIDDLDNLATPEEILLSAVSGEDAQDRSDRTILTPWVKFLWESYRQCLELLRTNSRVERLYHDIAKQAFRFCEKYSRKTEFRKLCDNLRTHLSHIQKQQGSATAVNLNNPETQQMNLETRLEQLNYAIKMELWQEAYKAIEDISDLMNKSKKMPKPHVMASYYQKLSLVFWKAGNQLFHAAALFKLFQLLRDQKKNITSEELGKRASIVLIATLAIPLPSAHPEFDRFIETEKSALEKIEKLATLLSLPKPPTRISLIRDLIRFNVVSAVPQELQNLYQLMEVEFDPLHLCNRMQSNLEWIQEHPELEQATSETLASEDWGLNLEVCDLINESEEGPRDAVKAIRKRLTSQPKNYSVVMYTLTVLETCVKNCDKRFHVLVCSKDFVQELVKLIGPKNEPPPAVQEKVLSLIQSWADAFRHQPELAGVSQVYADLKHKGVEFPMTNLDTMAPILTPQRTVAAPEPRPPRVPTGSTHFPSTSSSSPASTSSSCTCHPNSRTTSQAAQRTRCRGVKCKSPPYAAAPQIPPPQRAPQAEVSLIDLADEPPSAQLAGLTVGSSPKVKKNEDADFDMFAQSRTATYENAKVSGSSYQDNADVDVSGASLARTAQLRHNPQQKDSDFDAIEAWLNENPGEGQAGAGPRQEPISSSEFDRFLAERAAAADALPTITAATAPQIMLGGCPKLCDLACKC
ncbi:hypothetical protein C7M84_018709 [Penaeus vannamei]|uniref:VHS domain-containing protein n=1 Tax=Penaeus vannamei TaxID=6689 RepID=A0A3R7P7X8_PENVA|nr:hypothetical protein C7M84_018709 [Penaeus vannamei]